MRKLWFLAPVFGILLSTCSNEFDIAAPWKSIPVIYAFISPKDTAYYVRVEKAFLSPDKSALEVAQIADSLYYPENAIAVYLQEVGSTARYPLHRVDGVLEGIIRDSGVFATSPNYLYKIKPDEMGGPLKESVSYRLILEQNDGSQTITAETGIPGKFRITAPDPSAIPPTLDFTTAHTTSINWNTDVNGYYFNIYLKIRIKEVDANGQTSHMQFIWLAKSNVTRFETPSGAGGIYGGTAELSGKTFFDLLIDSIPPSSTKLRYFDGIDITLEGGGREIHDYLVVAQANAGLTGAEVFPTYTNLLPEGAGIGLFTAKNTFLMSNVKIKPTTVEALNAYSDEGKALNFQ